MAEYPTIKHLYVSNSAALNINNPALQEGTIWFCDEKKSMGLLLDGELKTFGHEFLLKVVDDNNIGSVLFDIINEIIVIKTRDMMLEDLEFQDANRNCIYLVKQDKRIVLTMNKEIVFEFTGN